MHDKKESLSLRSFKLAVDNSTDHTTLCDQNGVILYANKAVERTTGFPIKDVLGKKAGSEELWGGQMPKSFHEKMWHTIKIKKMPFSGVFKNKRKDGSTFYASANIFPVLDEAGNIKFFVEIHRDITRNIEFENSKTEFLSLAVHQLQTPLTIVKWFLEMLRQTPLTDEQNAFIASANDANERMIRTLSELRDATRIELGAFSIQPSPTDLKELASNTKAILKQAILKKSLKVREQYDDLPLVSVDQDIMTAVLRIILSNAVKYTPPNGKIRISLTLSKNKQNVVYSVADSGFGIRPDEREKIFSKMFRSEKARLDDPQGLGIGLFVVKSFIEAAGGRVWYESPSELGTKSSPGTVFYVSLPVSGMQPKSQEADTTFLETS